ncbi:MAG: agmatine deiminase family protein [Anaerolineae bacterium]|nr:agmatine deiminase family protein [Anaerolineae bacterium]
MMQLPIRLDFIPYPLWRRRGMPPFFTLWNAVSAADADAHPPLSSAGMAAYMARWRILPTGMDAGAARRDLDAMPITPDPPIGTMPPGTPPAATPRLPLRLPAQWEPMEAVIIAFPVLYPPLWETHLQMIEAITPAARVDVLIPHPTWAKAILLHLQARGRAVLDQVRLLTLPTDDIWVRDYGPFIGFDAEGRRAAVSAIYDPLPTYPQACDNTLADRYAARTGLPLAALDLHTEGGNFWSDGAGTLLLSDDLDHRHPNMTPEAVRDRLQAALGFERLITIPPLRHEETGHVDLAIKLADACTILIAAETPFNRDRLREARARLEQATNAAGERYRLITLPMPAPYLNWGVYPVWRSYTNALTVNGRVLVPTFGIAEDAAALDIYRRALPDFQIIGIDCRAAANGGGAVHCLTKEVPAEARRHDTGRRKGAFQYFGYF